MPSESEALAVVPLKGTVVKRLGLKGYGRHSLPTVNQRGRP